MTRRRAKLAVVVLSSLAAGGTLAACGDPVTANHDWQSISSRTSVTTVVNGVSQQVLSFDGVLSTGPKATPVAGTVFREECVGPAGKGPFKCLMLLNAGTKVYVATGQVQDLNKRQELVTLTNPAQHFLITTLAGGTMSSKLEISARTSLRAGAAGSRS